MTYYYKHDESGCALMSDLPPDEMMVGDGVVCDLLDRAQYERACEEFGQEPEPHPDPCLETQRRIKLSLAAWAYEMHDDPIMSDNEFDRLAEEIDTNRSTRRPDLDHWWMTNFDPCTGVWVRKHPEQDRLEALYQMWRGPKVSHCHSPFEELIRSVLQCA